MYMYQKNDQIKAKLDLQTKTEEQLLLLLCLHAYIRLPMYIIKQYATFMTRHMAFKAHNWASDFQQGPVTDSCQRAWQEVSPPLASIHEDRLFI